LLNATAVAAELRKLSFSLTLAGHLHEGYVQPPNPPATPPLYVFAAGTATQAVMLTDWEKLLLRTSYAALKSPSIQKQWKAAARKCSEFRTYEFDHARDAPRKVNVKVKRYRYDPNLLTFAGRFVGTYPL
jgi:hypothetical protein